MKTVRTLALAGLAALAFAARAEAPAAAPATAPAATGPKLDPAAAEAAKAAEAWLGLMDAGKYEQSWDEASALFRGKVTKERWVLQAQGVRGQLGKVTARALDRAAPMKVDGADAWVFGWKSGLEKLPEAAEIVTMLRDGGAWRCAGYFVKPRS
ncbi:MAG: DUF4019 domain-containing protein [Anaeromyxobacter sp.]